MKPLSTEKRDQILNCFRVKSVIIHTYKIVSFAAIKEENPGKSAELWKGMAALCNLALEALKGLKETRPQCGTAELYNLVLDYKLASDKRYLSNMQDAEWAKIQIPQGLFPSQS